MTFADIIAEAQKQALDNWEWLVFIGWICASLVDVSPIKIYPIQYIKNKISKCIRSFIKEIIKDMLVDVTDNIENLSKEICSIKSDLTEYRKEQKKDKIKRLRKEILDFGDQLMRNDNSEKQKSSYELILFDYYPEYEKLIKELEETNGIVTDAIDYIENKYHEHRIKNDFIR